MAATETEIVNQALIRIGEERIDDLDTDTNRAAVTAKAIYDQVRDELLQSYDWNFAIIREDLEPEESGGSDIEPTFGFSKQFDIASLSSTSLRIIGLYDEEELLRNYTSTKEPWKVENGKILADLDTAHVVYIAQITDVTKFDALFTSALILKLAVNLAYALSTGLKRVTQLEQQFDRIVRQARFTDAIQGAPEIITASDWLDSRGTGLENFRAGPILF